MRIILGGAEVPSNRTLLASMGVQEVALSFWNLVQRGLPKTKHYLIEGRFPDGMAVHAESGGPSLDASGWTKSEMEDYAAAYEAFVALNEGRLASATELDSRALGHAFVQDQRRTFWHDFGASRFRPVWHPEDTHAGLVALCDEYDHVAMPGSALDEDSTLAARTQSLARQGTAFHGLALARPDELRQVPLDTASTLAWLSPMRRGETIAWDGMKLLRYPARMKDQARRRLAAACERAGLDHRKVMDDDNAEVARLAIWSLRMLEESMNRRFTVIEGGDAAPVVQLPAHKDALDDPGSAEAGVSLPDRKEQRPSIEARDPREMIPLPVFGYDSRTIVDTDESGRSVLRDVQVVQSTQVSLRQCNTCFVAANCPAMKPNATCAFSLPVEVKTKDQLRALLNAIIEMQGSRVAFARFSEELNGGYPDPNVSQEIDRLFKLVAQLKELENSKDVMRMTIERQSAGGVLSAIFGDKAQALRELPDALSQPEVDRMLDRGLAEGVLPT